MKITENWKMEKLLLVLLITVERFIQFSHGKRVAPTITTHPPLEVAYKPDSDVELPCEATGYPPPKFYWTHNEKVLRQDGNLDFLLHDNGTIVLKKLRRYRGGFFQCVAWNEFGAAVSVKSKIQAAADTENEAFKYMDFAAVLDNHVEVGKPLRIRCGAPMYPTYNVSWHITDERRIVRPVATNERISIDYDGNLLFSNVLTFDGNAKEIYQCSVHNEFLAGPLRGWKEVILPITERPPFLTHPMPRPPKLMSITYSNILQEEKESEIVTNITVAKGSTIGIKCIFSGLPTPKVQFLRDENSEDYVENFVQLRDGQELIIANVDDSDEGFYQCSGTNNVIDDTTGEEMSTASKIVYLDVEWAPSWANGPPENVKAPVGGTATFECRADGKPAPEYSWTINGMPLSEVHSTTYSKRIKGGGQVLEFRNLGAHDSFVVQCNASNKHGYVLSNSHLLVEPQW